MTDMTMKTVITFFMSTIFWVQRNRDTSAHPRDPSYCSTTDGTLQEPLSDFRRPWPGNLRAGREMPKSQDSGGGGRQGRQEQDSLFQSEHDGSVGP